MQFLSLLAFALFSRSTDASKLAKHSSHVQGVDDPRFSARLAESEKEEWDAHNYIAAESEKEEEDPHNYVAGESGAAVANSGAMNLYKLIRRMGDYFPKAVPAKQPTLLSNHKVIFATVNTRSQDAVARLSGPPGWDWGVKNLAAGGSFPGVGKSTGLWKLRNEIQQKWVATLPGDQLVVFMDTDVLYGGCDLDEFVERFELLKKTSKSPLIFGAEFGCFEIQKDACLKFPVSARDEVLKAFNLEEAVVNHLGTGIGKTLKFLNGGFLVGRAKDLKVYLAEGLKRHDNHTDQYWASRVFRERPGLISLDYAAALVMNLFGVEVGSKFTFPGKKKRKEWMNTRTNNSVCFFHGNGDGKNMLIPLANTIKVGGNK